MLRGTFSSLINEVAKLLLEANGRSQKSSLVRCPGEWAACFLHWTVRMQRGFSVLCETGQSENSWLHPGSTKDGLRKKHSHLSCYHCSEYALRELEWRSLLLTQVDFMKGHSQIVHVNILLDMPRLIRTIHFSLNCSGKPIFCQLQKIYGSLATISLKNKGGYILTWKR